MVFRGTEAHYILFGGGVERNYCKNTVGSTHKASDVPRAPPKTVGGNFGNVGEIML
jgi:hypothetical protein